MCLVKQDCIVDCLANNSRLVTPASNLDLPVSMPDSMGCSWGCLANMLVMLVSKHSSLLVVRNSAKTGCKLDCISDLMVSRPDSMDCSLVKSASSSDSSGSSLDWLVSSSAKSVSNSAKSVSS